MATISPVRLNHAVLFVSDLARAERFYTEQARLTLVNAGAYGGESSHGATKSVYGADPDGNEFEIMWMLPREDWGAYENAAPVETLDLASELRRWSGRRTAGEVVQEATLS